MKIELISPFRRDLCNVGVPFRLPQMSLALLASITPSDMDISIRDELVQPVDFDTDADLVGITVNTKTAVRAYEIAEEFRKRNIPVVFGGIHPTVAPNEAIEHADALVLGEAETVWKQLLDDFRKGRLKRFYRSDLLPGLRNSPPPRRELFQCNKYATVNLVQTSRGCPYDCDFCSVSTLYGKGLRSRPVDDVIAEIRNLEGNKLFFVDDNIIGRAGYAKKFLPRLTPLRKIWIGQASVTVANNEEILRLLSKSGCLGLLIGFETTSADSLKEVGKNQNINNNYFESVKKFHDNGIAILGAFIVGFDSDDRSCFETLLEFAVKSKIDVVQFSILTPYPETALYKRLREEKRLLDETWWLNYEADDVVYRPKLMTREELYEGYIWTAKELYKLYPTLKRCLRGFFQRSLMGNIINWKGNMGYRRLAYAEPCGEADPLAARPRRFLVERHADFHAAHESAKEGR